MFLLTAVAVLLASSADLEASCMLLDASSAAFLACKVSWGKMVTLVSAVSLGGFGGLVRG